MMKVLLTCSLFLASVMAQPYLKGASTALSLNPPILIIPGTGGSQLEAKIDKPNTVHFYCNKKTNDFFPLWLSIPSLLPGSVDCWSDNIRLVYDDATDTFVNAPGVQTRTPGWGTTDGFDTLDKQGLAAYFKPLTQSLVSAGYKNGETLRGAPYDFRHSPSNEWLANMQNLVEDTFKAQGNRKVALVSHSMGCLYTLHFLHTMSDEWKTKYVLMWVPVAPVFGGSTNIIQLMASGANEGVPTVKGIWIRGEQRSYESNMWMIPSYKLWGDEQIAHTPDRSYSILQIEDFFKDIGYSEGFKYYSRTKDLTSVFEHPGVRVHILYSTGVDTPASFTWADGNFDEQPSSIEMGDGDGTVNKRSLLWGKSWEGVFEDYPVDHTEFKGVTHTGMIGNKDTTAKILSILRDAAASSSSSSTRQEQIFTVAE